jgi:RecJ-like exonuclease
VVCVLRRSTTLSALIGDPELVVAVFGVTRFKGVDREAHVKTCPDCNGDGVIEKGTDDEQQCPTCGGSGVVPDDDNDDEEVTRTAGW